MEVEFWLQLLAFGKESCCESHRGPFFPSPLSVLKAADVVPAGPCCKKVEPKEYPVSFTICFVYQVYKLVVPF